MNIGEIKAEALKLMFAGYDTIEEGTVAGLATDENYSVYLAGMVGSINRCLSDLEAKGALPEKRMELSVAEGEITGDRILFDLSGLAYSEIVRVVKAAAWGYDGCCPYDLEANVLTLDYDAGEQPSFALIYLPRAERVSLATSNSDPIDLPDYLACLVPYFIKGDLYRDDEPSEAAEARNYYEAAVAALLSKKQQVNVQSRVDNRYDLL